MYKDYLKEYMGGKIREYLRDSAQRDTLPAEFDGLSDNRMIELVSDGAVPVLRGMEDIAISSAIERACFMIRFSRKQEIDNKT